MTGRESGGGKDPSVKISSHSGFMSFISRWPGRRWVGKFMVAGIACEEFVGLGLNVLIMYVLYEMNPKGFILTSLCPFVSLCLLRCVHVLVARLGVSLLLGE
jgi:hypothetical protein